MTDRVTVGNLRVAQVLYDFINNEALPGTDIDPDSFWAGVDKVVTDLSPQNQDLLARRDDLQAQIDKYHRQHVIEPIDPDGYKQFLTEIGYLQPEPDDFTITTAGVSTTRSPRPQARSWWCRSSTRGSRSTPHNARWGSLYDALYGTRRDPARTMAPRRAPATTRCAATRSSPTRGVPRWRRTPLASGAWSEATGARDRAEDGSGQLVTLGDGLSTGLADARAVRRLHR